MFSNALLNIDYKLVPKIIKSTHDFNNLKFKNLMKSNCKRTNNINIVRIIINKFSLDWWVDS